MSDKSNTSEIHATSENTTSATSEAHQTPAAHPQSAEFSSIPDLFKKSWELLTSALFNALMLMISSSLLSFVVVIGFFIALAMVVTASAGVGISEVFSESFDPMTLLTPQFFTGLGVSVLIFGILGAIVSATFSSAFILAFAQAEEKPRIRSLIKEGFGVSGWVILYGLVTGVLSIGAFGFFLIPAIAMSILFMFGIYEVIIAKKGPVAAMKRSTTVVAEHFGEIFVRIILFFLLNMAVLYLLPAIFGSISEEVGAMYSVINFIISIVFGWYGTAFAVQLYKEATTATPADKQRTGLFSTLIIVSVIGLFLFGAFVSFGLSRAREALDAGSIPALISKELNQEMSMENDMLFQDLIADANTVESSCGFDLHLPTTSADDGTGRYWIYEERPVAPAAFRGLIPDNQMGSGPLAAVVSFKSNDDRFGDAQNFNLGFPGYNIFCIDNVNEYDLDGFVAAAQEAEGKTVELDGETEEWGAVTVQPTYVSGLNANGDYYKEPLYLGVVPGADSKLVVFIPWGTRPDDEMESQINEDMTFIRNTFSYYSEEEMQEMFKELNTLEAMDAAEQPEEL